MAGDRFCPLCDDYLAVDVCPAHGVPTIAKLDSSEPLVKLDVGTVIAGRYRVERFLRQGGMGVVLLARQLPNEQKVVVKVLKNDRLALRNNLRRFYQEARVISRLHHKNIVRIFEFGFDAPTRVPFLAMELIEGRTIRDIVKTDGTFSEDHACAVLAEVARALVEAHDKGVLYRDLKPVNIMLVHRPDGADDVKVLDFGLAKVLEPEEGTKPFTAPGQAVGTPAFMAPEQITQSPQDFRTDLYGLGCVLHVMLTGGPPFDGPDRMEVMRKQIRETPPPLPELLADGLPPSEELIALHKKLLAKNRPDRPASTTEVVTLLERLALRADSEGNIETIKTETVLAIGLKAPSIKSTIPEAQTVRDERAQHSSSGEPNTQPEVQSYRESSSSSSAEGSDSSTRLLHRSFDHALLAKDPSEKKRDGFGDEEELWTSVLPSSMESEPEGMTPVIDGGELKPPSMPVHDLRALASPVLLAPQTAAGLNGDEPGRSSRPAAASVTTPISTISAIPTAASALRPMPSVGAIMALPARRPRVSRENKVVFVVGLAAILAILLSVIAIVARGDRSTNRRSDLSAPPAAERR